MKCINATNLNRNPGERTRISYFTALPAATYAALRKESRMKSTEATVFDRKSGAAEGPAVRLSWTQLPHECRQTVGLRRHFDGTSNVPEKKTRLNRERPRHLVTMFGVGISPFYQPIRRSPIP
jgi:hypothetical protein